MVGYNADTTNPALLNRLGDWRDHEAWLDFVKRYDPIIRSSSRRYRLDPEAMEDLCQLVWIDLARRMRTYRYDPGKRFRGWLRRLCQSRAIDLLRKKKSVTALQLLDDQPGVLPWEDSFTGGDFDEDERADRPALLLQAEEVQRAIRQRIDERTWQVFWTIAIEGESIRVASQAAGISYYAAFAAQKRVGRLLREEGQRFMLHGSDRPETNGVAID